MQTLFDYLNANPWIYGVMAASLVVWIAALWVIFASPKFLRKWLWMLLAFVSFSYSWPVADNFTFGIGLPLGALYVMWFWRFGKSPTPEEIAERGPKLKQDQHIEAPTGGAGQRIALRTAYVIASLASLTLAIWAGLGHAVELMDDIAGELPSPELREIWSAVRYPQAVFGILFTGLFVFLVTRPYWWGKILCLWAAVSWLGFGVAVMLMWQADPRLFVPIGTGSAMLLAFIIHQIADPRFTGTYLRQS